MIDVNCDTCEYNNKNYCLKNKQEINDISKICEFYIATNRRVYVTLEFDDGSRARGTIKIGPHPVLMLKQNGSYKTSKMLANDFKGTIVSSDKALLQTLEAEGYKCRITSYKQKYNKKTFKTIGAGIRIEECEKFSKLCKENGTTMRQAIKRYIESCIADNKVFL